MWCGFSIEFLAPRVVDLGVVIYTGCNRDFLLVLPCVCGSREGGYASIKVSTYLFAPRRAGRMGFFLLWMEEEDEKRGEQGWGREYRFDLPFAEILKLLVDVIFN